MKVFSLNEELPEIHYIEACEKVLRHIKKAQVCMEQESWESYQASVVKCEKALRTLEQLCLQEREGGVRPRLVKVVRHCLGLSVFLKTRPHHKRLEVLSEIITSLYGAWVHSAHQKERVGVFS